MSAGISAPHDPHPSRTVGIHEPHPGPRASLPASLCPPRPITRRVRILGASRDRIPPSAQPEPQPPTVVHPPRTPLGIHEHLPGSAGALAGPSRPIERRVKSCVSIKADVREISPDYISWNPAGEGAGAPSGASSWSAGIPARIALPTTPHRRPCHAKPVNRGRRVQSLTRLHLVQPCRRGRRRSQRGLILVSGHPCPHRFAP